MHTGKLLCLTIVIYAVDARRSRTAVRCNAYSRCVVSPWGLHTVTFGGRFISKTEATLVQCHVGLPMNPTVDTTHFR